MRASNEACDDGNLTANDGCSATCTVDTGYTCTSASPNVCSTTCGDGIQAGNEVCDDGNTSNNDGCSATCIQEGHHEVEREIPHENCSDGSDNDGDHLIDQEDPECPALPTTENCTNGADDDGDTLIDQFDNSDCPAVCSSGLDDDSDGIPNEVDTDCGYVDETIVCASGADDDADGVPNEVDEQCSQQVTTNEVCASGGDDDNDGIPNEIDGDCSVPQLITDVFGNFYDVVIHLGQQLGTGGVHLAAPPLFTFRDAVLPFIHAMMAYLGI